MVKTIIVCVEFDDLLAVTLPHNLQFLDDVTIVTSPNDGRTVALVDRIVSGGVSSDRGWAVRLMITDAFYRNGAAFNKGLAIEEAFDAVGRDGWLLVLDADILLSTSIPWSQAKIGNLHSCRRRMCKNPAFYRPDRPWNDHPRLTEHEMAGYFHLFHASDPALASRPWYASWKHAGGCDSDFQARWPEDHKVYLSIEALHLGPDGLNWQGRATPRLDGLVIPQASQRARAMEDIHAQRRALGGTQAERLP